MVVRAALALQLKRVTEELEFSFKLHVREHAHELFDRFCASSRSRRSSSSSSTLRLLAQQLEAACS